jgi:hypothetical protein
LGGAKNWEHYGGTVEDENLVLNLLYPDVAMAKSYYEHRRHERHMRRLVLVIFILAVLVCFRPV